MRTRGKPTDLFESFQLIENNKILVDCVGHTCGEYNTIKLEAGEQIIGMYGNTEVGNGLLKAVGFIVWMPPF